MQSRRSSARRWIFRSGKSRVIQQDCPAIAVPKPEFGMNEHAKRRRVQPFGGNRPLLKWLPRPV
jgi:hypothetical protein